MVPCQILRKRPDSGMAESSRDETLIDMRDVCWTWSLGGALVVDWAVFDATKRPVEDVPSSTCHCIITNGRFCFRILVCCQVGCDCPDRWQIHQEFLFRSVMVSVGVDLTPNFLPTVLVTHDNWQGLRSFVLGKNRESDNKDILHCLKAWRKKQQKEIDGVEV
jgi:hypothetical protein